MATQPPQPTLTQQFPAYQFPHQHPHPHGYNIPFGGRSCGCGPWNTSNSTSDPHTRIAVLEKELEHCQTGKAEAEVAVQYLATLNANRAANVGNGDDQTTKLKQQLAQAEKEKEAFEAKLENALAIIKTILTSKTTTQALLAPNRKFFEGGPASGVLVHDEDLIDFVAASKGSDSSSTSENDTTLLDQSCNDFLEDVAQHPGQAKHSLVSEMTDGEDEPYIHHFVPIGHHVPFCGDGNLKKAFQVPTSDARRLIHPKNSASSPDQRSETSFEPDTDVSSHEYAASSDGPASSSTSFVTANTRVNGAQKSPAETVAKKADEAQALRVQKWNVAASATSFEEVEASGAASDFAKKNWSSKSDKKSSVVKSPSAPLLNGPSWQVRNLFSSRRQREDTIAYHQCEVGPDERTFPDLFKYGVRFEPDDSERNVYRTILIRGLSSDTTMNQLLQNVRGGKVIDAKLLETCNFIGSNSALIGFLHEHAAIAYEEYARINPLTINNQLVNVKVLNSPTWPTRIGLKKAIEDHQHTRCLEAHKFPRHVSQSQLLLDLRVCDQMHGDRIEHLKMRKDGTLELHFSSIDYAGRGFGILTNFRKYRGCKAEFVPDPCAQPVESLDHGRGTDTGNPLVQKGRQCVENPAEVYDRDTNLAINIQLESSNEEFDTLPKIEWETKPEDRRGGCEFEKEE